MKHQSTFSNVVYWLYDETCRVPEHDGYVGITCDIEMRMMNHRNLGRFPVDRVLFLHYGTREECAAVEKQYRPQPNIGWNISSGGSGGYIPSLATRQRQSAAKLGKKQSPELIAKRTANQAGRRHSAESRARMSAAMQGKLKSQQHRAKLSAANKGKRPSPETRAKLSAAKFGKKLTAQHRKNVSDSIRRWHRERFSGPVIDGG